MVSRYRLWANSTNYPSFSYGTAPTERSLRPRRELRVSWYSPARRGVWRCGKRYFIKGSSRARLRPRLPTHRSMPPSVNLQLCFGRGPCHFFGGVGGAPFAEGLDAFSLGGPAFFGFRTSLPFAIFTSFTLVGGAPVADPCLPE